MKKKKDKRKEILKNVEKSDMRFRRRKIKEKQQRFKDVNKQEMGEN